MPMSEMYQASEIAGPADDAAAMAPHEVSSPPESADNLGSYPDAVRDDGFASYSDADIDAILAAEDQLPESRTRQEAAADTWNGSPDDPVVDESSSEYDGDVAALLTAEEQLPESQTRQEAAAATWDDTTQPGDDDPGEFSGDPASEYDGDVAALLAAEEQLPEPRTRQEAAAATWGDTNSGQDAGMGGSTDKPSVGQSDTVAEPSEQDREGVDGTPDPQARQVAVHSQDGTEVPITVEYVPPEDRTVGDTTPTGIGRKPTGEELLGMDDNPAESRLDRLFEEVTEDASDARDAAANISETLHNLRLPGPDPGGGHTHEIHPVQEPVQPAGPGFSDLVGSTALVGVALLTCIRYGFRQLGKGDRR